MTDDRFQTYQADMRSAYINGAPGVLTSGVVWLLATVVSATLSQAASIGTLLVGGTLIFPVSVLICRLFGATGKHRSGNPLGRLAIEGTLWLMAGIFIAWATTFTGNRLFFPVMLLVIGSRYLTFQTIYGLPHYWIAGAALCIAGFLCAIFNAPAHIAAGSGSLIEMVLGVPLWYLAHRESNQEREASL